MDTSALRERLLKEFISKNKGKLAQPSLYDTFMGFIHAIDWTEPWVAGALCYYVLLLLVVVITRRHWNAQAGIFVFVCGAVYLAPRINAALGANWRTLGFTQNYFDERGVFISTLYSAPLLVIATVQMLMAFFGSASMLIKVKKQQLADQRRARAAAATSGNAAPAAAVADAAPAAAASVAEPKKQR